MAARARFKVYQSVCWLPGDISKNASTKENNAKVRRKISLKNKKGKIQHDTCNAIVQQLGCAWLQAILTSCT
jgi:hypothetical protein